MIKGFKDFLVRGNVVDLAVGFVMGVAFTTVVTQFTESFLEPLIRVVSGGEGLDAGAVTIRGVPFDWATFVNALFTFLLTAAAVYFVVVLPMNRLAERRRRGQEPPPESPSEEVRLLTEIRDLLATARIPEQSRRAEQPYDR
jgi:large conductance mechanosensitive channel